MNRKIICGMLLTIGLAVLAPKVQAAKTSNAAHDHSQHQDHSQHHDQSQPMHHQPPGQSTAWMFSPAQSKAATLIPQVNPIVPLGNCPAGSSDEPFGDSAPNGCPKAKTPPSVGDPISLTDGSFWMRIPCFTLGGAGRPITFSLHYDTHKWTDGIGDTALGIGWVGSYSRRLNTSLGNAVYIVLEDGTWKDWKGSTATGYDTEQRNRAKLSFNSSSSEYVVTYVNGDRDFYSSEGMLKRVEDRMGNVTSVGSFVVANGIGTRRITNLATNQSLVLEHSDINNLWRLTKVTESGPGISAPRQMALSYGVSGNDTGLLTKVIDEAGRAYTFSYDLKGRVSKYWDALNDPATNAAAIPVENEYAIDGWSGIGHGKYDEMAVKTQTRGDTRINISLAYLGDFDVNSDLTKNVIAILYQRTVERQKRIGGIFQTLRKEHFAIGVLRSDGDGYSQQILHRQFVPVSANTNVNVMTPDPSLSFVEHDFHPSGRKASIRLRGPGLLVDRARRDYFYNSDGAMTEVREYSAPGVYATTTMANNSFGQPLSITLPNGQKTEYTYDAKGWVTSIKRIAIGNAGSQTTSMGYAPVIINGQSTQIGLPTNVTLPDGTINTQTYDSLGYPSVLTLDAGGGRTNLTERTTFDGRGFLLESTDRRGIRTTYQYLNNPAAGQFGNLGIPSSMVADANGRAIRSEYKLDAMLNPTQSIADAGAGRLNATTSISYEIIGSDGVYAPTQIINAENRTVRMSYDGLGQLERLTEVGARAGGATGLLNCSGANEARAIGNDRVTRFCYTAEGFAAKTILDDGRVAAEYGYAGTGDGLPRAIKDARGATTQFVYDTRGRLTMVRTGAAQLNENGGIVGPQNLETTYAYDSLDRVTQVTSGGRLLASYQYDSFGRFGRETDGAGNYTTYFYDPNRNFSTAVETGSGVPGQSSRVLRTYDRLGRLLTQTLDPAGKKITTNYSYDGVEKWFPTSMSNARGVRTEYRYDIFGQLSGMTDAHSSVWSYSRNNLGYTTATTPPGSSAATTYAVNKLGEVTALYRDGQSETWAYNSDGRLAQYRDFSGQTVTHSYDATGRLLGMDYSGTASDAGGARADVDSIQYWPNDLVRAVTSRPNGVTAETTSYTFDAANRLRSRVRGGRDVGYSYNADNTLNTINYFNRSSVSYGYGSSNNGLVRSITPLGLGASSYGYRSDNQLSSVTRASGLNSSFAFDSASRLTNIQHTAAGVLRQAVGYELDQNGNRTKITENMPGINSNPVTRMGYDALDRLTRVGYDAIGSNAAGDELYKYDAVGNRMNVMKAKARHTGNINADIDTNMTWHNYAASPSAALAWTMQGTGGNTIAGGKLTNFAVSNTYRLALGDLGGDGFSEMIWFNRGGDRTIVAWDVNETTSEIQVLPTGGLVQDPSGAANATAAPGFELVGAADFNHDGIDDLVWFNPTSNTPVVYFMAKVGAKYRYTGAQTLQTPGTGFMLEGVGDFNRDGNPDLVWQSNSGETLVIWHMSYDGTKLVHGGVVSNTSGQTQLVAAGFRVNSVGDANKDGIPDLYFVNEASGSVVIWYMGGPEGLTYLSGAPTSSPVTANTFRLGKASDSIHKVSEQTLSYNARDHVVSAGFSYDANGNLLTMPAWNGQAAATYTYTAANKLKTSTVNGVTTEYFYDGSGNLVRSNRNGVITDYVHDESAGLPRVIAEISGNTETLYAFGPDGLHAQRKWVAGTAQNGEYPISDGLGSIKGISSNTGSISKFLSHDAWGQTRYDSNAGVASGFGFTGEQQFADGTINLRARTYVPALGRFLQRDSFAGFEARPQSLNRYAYVEGNPGNLVDPSGHFSLYSDSPNSLFGEPKGSCGCAPPSEQDVAAMRARFVKGFHGAASVVAGGFTAAAGAGVMAGSGAVTAGSWGLAAGATIPAAAFGAVAVGAGSFQATTGAMEFTEAFSPGSVLGTNIAPADYDLGTVADFAGLVGSASAGLGAISRSPSSTKFPTPAQTSSDLDRVYGSSRSRYGLARSQSSVQPSVVATNGGKGLAYTSVALNAFTAAGTSGVGGLFGNLLIPENDNSMFFPCPTSPLFPTYSN
jgi:RHS repeat-associated protein